MPEPGGVAFDSKLYQEQLLRAELANIASAHCYQHGHKVVDDILARYTVTRKPMKELKAS